MALGTLSREERIGLGLAVALHAALLGLLALRPPPAPLPLPQRITVTLSPDVGVTAAAPTHADAAAAIAPRLGAPAPAPPPPKVETPPVEKPAPEPQPVATARPQPVRITRLIPAAIALPPPDAPAAAAARPVHKHQTAAKSVLSVKDWDLAAPAAPDHQPAGGSRIGNDFLKGIAGGKAGGKARQQGAAVIGPEVKSALSGAIAQQLKPHWLAPQGVDADKLVTILAWDLNPDGTLAGAPRLVRQEGVTDSNRPQAARHAEQAIRAVELAVPFKLPARYYDAWKHVGASRFDRTLSQ